MTKNNLGKGENVIESFLKDAIKEADKLYEENASLSERISDLEELNRIYVDFLVKKGYELRDVIKGDVE